MSGLIDRANTLLTGGHVVVTHVKTAPGSRHPVEVRAYVLDGSVTLAVEKAEGLWTCPCGWWRCSHRVAVQLVTGQPGKARADAAVNAAGQVVA